MEAQAAAASQRTQTQTHVGDLPEVCLAQAIALTSPRDACRCAAVSPAFRAAADSDDVWRSFLPQQLLLPLLPVPDRQHKHRFGSGSGISIQEAAAPPSWTGCSSKINTTTKKKDAYLGLCDAASAVSVDGGGCRVWLERASGARCYALSARRLSLPWDDGEYCWRFTHHPRSRFAEVAVLVDCTSLDIYGTLPASMLTPATAYAAFLVYGTTESESESESAAKAAYGGPHVVAVRGLSYPDQETAVAVGGRVVARHAVCLRPDEAEARKFRGGKKGGGEKEPEPRRPAMRQDGWWEMEMGRLRTGVAVTTPVDDAEVVQASFEVLGWYPKRGLVVEGIEFRPIHHSLS